jgi:hypothetical protein
MDLTESIAPKSDQLNAEDLLTGPRTFTIEKVEAGSIEQPVNVHLVELPGRPYRPSKSMRRIMVAAWGPEAAAYAGRRITLVRNPEIKFGGAAVGGIEIAAMSNLPKRLTVSLMVTKGKRKPFNVDPLPAAPAPAPDAIPAEVRVNAEKAATNGTTADYLAWLKEQNAPAHILEFVTNTSKETN